MNYEFWGEHVFLAFCVIVGGFSLAGAAINALWLICNRILRTIKVCKHGWPPAHLDADGDWKPEPKIES